MEVQEQIINLNINTNAVKIIKDKYKAQQIIVNHLGIQAKEGTIFLINNQEIQIGSTGIYEITDCVIESIYIKENNENIIDCIFNIE